MQYGNTKILYKKKLFHSKNIERKNNSQNLGNKKTH